MIDAVVDQYAQSLDDEFYKGFYADDRHVVRCLEEI